MRDLREVLRDELEKSAGIDPAYDRYRCGKLDALKEILDADSIDQILGVFMGDPT